jgi:hypothetical protein
MSNLWRAFICYLLGHDVPALSGQRWRRCQRCGRLARVGGK